MKYIRTKDGIYSVYTDDLNLNDEVNVEIAGFRTKYCRCLDKPILKGDIVKVADTIEELCDEFVYRDLYDYKLSKKIIDMLDNKDKTKIYGAIWTDKGLIYVSKLNNRGEWELL